MIQAPVKHGGGGGMAWLAHVLHLPLSLNCRRPWGSTDDFTTSFLHFSLLSIALWVLANSRPVHSLMLSFHHFFFCLPCLLSPFTLLCKIVLARRDEQETCPYHFSLHLFMMSVGLCVVRLPAGSWHRLPLW